jgi:hypothetical protein
MSFALRPGFDEAPIISTGNYQFLIARVSRSYSPSCIHSPPWKLIQCAMGGYHCCSRIEYKLQKEKADIPEYLLDHLGPPDLVKGYIES